jgi:thiosulfate/3-mercaptopyruvate sulfurtransferase
VDAGFIAAQLGGSKACVIDARSADRYRGENETLDPVAGHIPGAASAPYTANLDASGRFRSPEELRARFADLLGATPPEGAVAYCGSGVNAGHTLLALAHAGLGMGRLYAGSWSEWIADPARPIATGEE